MDYFDGRVTYSVQDGPTDLVRSVDVASGDTRTTPIPSKVGGTIAASDGTQIAAPGYAGQVYARIHPDGAVRYVELNATRLFTLRPSTQNAPVDPSRRISGGARTPATGLEPVTR